MAGEEPAGGPHCFQDGNGLFLFFEKSGQGALDTDAGQQQSEDPNQAEKKKKIIKLAVILLSIDH